jgi:hypothetical protein
MHEGCALLKDLGATPKKQQQQPQQQSGLEPSFFGLQSSASWGG